MTASARSIPFCCLNRWALETLSFFFCFFLIPEVARSAKTEGLWSEGDSARGSEVKDLSRSRLGDAALRAARERGAIWAFGWLDKLASIKSQIGS
jgi:hypothetical protein